MIINKNKSYTICADAVQRPDCLAYAIESEMFSDEQLQNIPFDHGETPTTFVSTYGRKNLLSVLREELLSPKLHSKGTGSYDPHPVSSFGR